MTKNKELPKAYNSQDYEDKIYQKWEESGFFNPDVCVAKGICQKNAKTYTIVLPPPNITDKLHLGHGVMIALEDILIRYYRMNGRRALWIPGTDHAAIATQNVVEKKLLKEENKTRHDLGKEKFLEKVWEFVKETQSTILQQIRKSGASLDWSREAFTLDQERQTAVRKMFVDMYQAGVIYRGYRLVNWCPRCQSTLSDDEVDHKESNAKFYTFQYAKDFPFAISTTRPETKLGDTAVAVNPKDKRYQKYIGQQFDLDFCGVPLHLKIIGDPQVDMKLGTGALGVTPAHSMIDYEMAMKNKLEIVKVINEEGKIEDGMGEFSGLSVLAARQRIVDQLRGSELLINEEDINNNLSICYRCDTAIEPLPSKQWFVSVDKKLKRLKGKSLKEAAIDVAKTQKIKFTPDRFYKRYIDWMENLHDWCISRQIWFGHRLPVWYKGDEVYVGEEAPQGDGWQQDMDSLDTWFSSGMWTFSTLGWPDKAGDLKDYHPNQVLETGYEIITLWISRMVMMSLFALQEIPFENVYLHGMILDKDGKKMSKSKGNGIDPFDVISKYGADAMRLSLVIGSTPGNDSRLSEDKIASYRNFTNKLWNIARYIIGSIDFDQANKEIDPKTCSLADTWILDKMSRLITNTRNNIEEYKFSLAGEQMRDFTWNDLADWYVEVTKFEKNENKDIILLMILRDLLKLWHPYMPFVTETIWQKIESGNLLMVASFPEAKDYDKIVKKAKHKTEEFDLVKNIISVIRNIRAEYQIKPAQKIKAIIHAGKQTDLLNEQGDIIKNLFTRIETLEIVASGDKPKQAAMAAVQDIDIIIPLADLVDMTKEKERINKRLEELEKLSKSIKAKLANIDFKKNAPADILSKEEEKLAGYQDEASRLKKQFENLK